MGRACGEGEHVVSPVKEEVEFLLPSCQETGGGLTACWDKKKNTEDIKPLMSSDLQLHNS